MPLVCFLPCAKFEDATISSLNLLRPLGNDVGLLLYNSHEACSRSTDLSRELGTLGSYLTVLLKSICRLQQQLSIYSAKADILNDLKQTCTLFDAVKRCANCVNHVGCAASRPGTLHILYFARFALCTLCTLHFALCTLCI